MITIKPISGRVDDILQGLTNINLQAQIRDLLSMNFLDECKYHGATPPKEIRTFMTATCVSLGAIENYDEDLKLVIPAPADLMLSEFSLQTSKINPDCIQWIYDILGKIKSNYEEERIDFREKVRYTEICNIDNSIPVEVSLALLYNSVTINMGDVSRAFIYNKDRNIFMYCLLEQTPTDALIGSRYLEDLFIERTNTGSINTETIEKYLQIANERRNKLTNILPDCTTELANTVSRLALLIYDHFEADYISCTISKYLGNNITHNFSPIYVNNLLLLYISSLVTTHQDRQQFESIVDKIMEELENDT